MDIARLLLAQGPVIQNDLTQFGVMGVLAAVLIGTVRVLYKRVTETATAETARANKWEQMYVDLSKELRDRHVSALDRNTEVIQAVSRLVPRE